MLTILLSVLRICKGDQVVDKIISVLGQPLVSVDHYVEYVPVNQKEGRALLYWLTKVNDQHSSKLPRVIWLNGGQYKYREFYICRESYAGNYIPQLAKKVYR